MRWIELENEWKKVFELSWISFCEGNLPIAAIITDPQGNILSTGRNNFNISKKFPNPKVDHAETDCMQSLNINEYKDVRNYILYTNMEPCPMCIGTIVMGNIRHIRIAAKDGYGGATDLCDKNEYMANKHMDIQFMDEIYGTIQIAFHSYVELRDYGRCSNVLKKFRDDYPRAVEAAELLYIDNVLDKCLEEEMPYDEVFDLVCKAIDDISDGNRNV